MNSGDEIFKLLQRCNKNINTPDLHSFIATIKNGSVWVECRGNEVYIESTTCDKNGKEAKSRWVGNTIAAANRLEMFEMNLQSVEI